MSEEAPKKKSIFDEFMKQNSKGEKTITPNEDRSVRNQIVEDQAALDAAEAEVKHSKQVPLKPGEVERVCQGCGQVYRGLPDSVRIRAYKQHVQRHPTHAGFGK